MHKKKGQVREPPSVPFLWEIKPGIPKKDWKPDVTSIGHTPKPPLKLITSIPFASKQHGRPLNPSIHPSEESVLPNPLPSAQDTVHCSRSYRNGNKGRSDSVCQQGCCSDEQDWISEWDSESFSYEMDGSFRSVSSFASKLSLTVSKNMYCSSTAKSLSSEVNSDKLEIANSPTSESGNSTSRYATRCSSPTGAAFLECIFPLIPPRSSFLEKIENSESIQTPPGLQHRDFYQETNSNVILRRPPTLGELIMMSRRRSCQRSAVQMRKQNLSMEIKKHGCFGFFFTKGGNMIHGFHTQKKFLPRPTPV